MTYAADHNPWQSGQSYDQYMGRWSRKIAPQFLDWLAMDKGLRWLDVGCGTGALSDAVLHQCDPKSLIGIDPSEGFVAQARANVVDARAQFFVGDAQVLNFDTASHDIAVSALALNFVPDRVKAVAEMKRVVRPGGVVAFYVWDYPGGGVEFMDAFWSTASGLDPNARDLNQALRFPFCTQSGLIELARQAGLTMIECAPIETPTIFHDFEDYWRPFTLGAGLAPAYCAALDAQARQRLLEALHETLPRSEGGSISLHARAWAVNARS
jgi:SAM-dependent methyltransferase